MRRVETPGAAGFPLGVEAVASLKVRQGASRESPHCCAAASANATRTPEQEGERAAARARGPVCVWSVYAPTWLACLRVRSANPRRAARLHGLSMRPRSWSVYAPGRQVQGGLHARRAAQLQPDLGHPVCHRRRRAHRRPDLHRQGGLGVPRTDRPTVCLLGGV
jgi:hypothetical protein